MKRIYDVPGVGTLNVPDCECCEDRGAILSPTMDLRGRRYLGHPQPCPCGACATWPAAMRDWAERRALETPHRAIPADTTGALRYESLYPCPYCLEGRAFGGWVRDRGRPGREPVFQPSPAQRYGYSSPMGREYAEIYLAAHPEIREPDRRRLSARAERTVGERIGKAMPATGRSPMAEETDAEIAAAEEQRRRQKAAIEQRERERRRQALGEGENRTEVAL